VKVAILLLAGVGLDPMWLSGIILVIVYIVLIMEKLNRAVTALLGAMLMIYCGLLNQHQALEKVDFNTLWLLTGMMMLVRGVRIKFFLDRYRVKGRSYV